MESNKVSTLLEEANKEAYEKNIKILACLNELKAIIEKSTAQPFEINKDDKYESEINIRNSVSYLEESSLEINNFESINLKLFKLLFIPNGHLKYVDLDEKIKDYQLALKLLKNELKAEEKIDYIDKVIKIKKIIGWKKLLKSTFVTISDLGLIIAIVLKFSKSIVEISDFLMFILKKKHFYNFEIKFDLNNLIDAHEANIAESFNNLFKNDTEYFYLDFENGNIVKKSLSAEETSKAINQTENENQDSKKKNKKKKNKKNKKKSEHSQELISESIKGEDAKTTTVSQKEEKPDEKENSKKDESEKNETKNIEITEEEGNQSEKNIATINKIRIILKESVAKYLKSNENAHILDKSKPILAQLFSLIEPNDNYEEVINKLVSIRADA